MTTPQPYIVQPDGWHVKKPNFYSKYIDNPMHNAVNPKWEDFERNNPPLPLTAWHQPRSEVAGRIVWQWQDPYTSDKIWKAEQDEESHNYSVSHGYKTRQAFSVTSNVGGEKPVDNEYDHMPQGCKDAGKCIYTACSCKTNSAIFFEPVDEAKPELTVTDLFNAIELGQKEHLYLLNKVNQEANMQTLGGHFDYQTIVESCKAVEKLKAYTHAIQSKELVKLSDVERVINDRIIKLGKYNSMASRQPIIDELEDLLFQLSTLKNSK